MTPLQLPLVLALLAHGVNDVAHWPPRVLRGEVPTTGAAARLPPRTAALMRFAGELGLDGWLGEGVLLLSDGGEKEARELLAQAVRARSAVERFGPAQPIPTRDAPLVVFHLRRAATYRSLLGRLVQWEEDRDGLLASAREASGFELAEPPLCAVCSDLAATGARGEPDRRSNLLVHLVAHAFFDAGFGAAPEWLREGFALDVEAEICGEPDAFCRRGPHELAQHDSAKRGAAKGAAWTRRLCEEWSDAADLRFDELFELAPDGYHEATAWRALALVRWLRERRASKFLEVVEAAADAQRAACAGSPQAPESAALQSRGLELALGARWRGEFLEGLADLSGARGRGKGSR
jgi:hypothetical protein